MARLFLTHFRWVAAGVLLIAALLLVGRCQSNMTVSEYYIAANGGYGSITLISTRSDAHFQARVPQIGAISSIALFKGNLILCSSYSSADPSGPDPARGLWLVSLSDGKTSRCNESMLSGPVYMCTVLDGSLWFLEGSKLWSTADLLRFELRQDDVRTVVAVSPSTIVMQQMSGNLSWISVEDGVIKQGALGKVFGDSTMDTMFGSHAYFNDWSVLHLPVPGVDQNQSLAPPPQDPSWAFRAFFDTRYNNWISVRNSVARVYPVSRVRTSGDTKDAFTVRRGSVVHVIQISEQEFDMLENVISAWKAK